MSDGSAAGAGHAFALQRREVEFFRALLAIAELGATRELAIDELVQRFGSHGRCVAHLRALRLHAIETLDGWESAVVSDAIQKGISLLPPEKLPPGTEP